MNGAIALKQYQQMGVHGAIMDASPHRLIQMLLDGALTRILSAKGHMRQNNISKKGEQIGSAISIIESLKASLDFEQGGDISHCPYSEQVRRACGGGRGDVQVRCADHTRAPGACGAQGPGRGGEPQADSQGHCDKSRL